MIANGVESGVESPERRELLRQALLLAGVALVPPGITWLLRMFPVNPPSLPVLKKTIFDVYGLHDAPNVGGSMNIALALDDAKRLGAHGLTAIDPSEGLLTAFKAAGIPPLSRIYQPKNRFNAPYLRREMAKISRYLEGERPVIQPYNEVNLLAETGESPITPESHIINHFLPAVDIIADGGGTTLLTPLAFRAENEQTYFTGMLDTLRPHRSALEGKIALGLHAYIFDSGENPLEYVQKRYHLAREKLGFELPIFVTEAGLYQTTRTGYPDGVVSAETIRMLNTPIPPDLPLEGFNLWVASNYAQRSGRRNKTLDDFEVAALRGINGVTKTFLAIEELARQRLLLLQAR